MGNQSFEGGQKSVDSVFLLDKFRALNFESLLLGGVGLPLGGIILGSIDEGGVGDGGKGVLLLDDIGESVLQLLLLGGEFGDSFIVLGGLFLGHDFTLLIEGLLVLNSKFIDLGLFDGHLISVLFSLEPDLGFLLFNSIPKFLKLGLLGFELVHLLRLGLSHGGDSGDHALVLLGELFNLIGKFRLLSLVINIISLKFVVLLLL